MFKVNAIFVQIPFIVRQNMKLAIIGSRNVTHIDIEKHIPDGVSEILRFLNMKAKATL